MEEKSFTQSQKWKNCERSWPPLSLSLGVVYLDFSFDYLHRLFYSWDYSIACSIFSESEQIRHSETVQSPYLNRSFYFAFVTGLGLVSVFKKDTSGAFARR